MPDLVKHVGRYGEKPCVIIFREMPDDRESCLIVTTGGLPDRMHDELMTAVQSQEAQKAHDIADVLSRKQFSDGQQMLNGLHYGKYMTKVKVEQVAVTPMPNASVPLKELNDAIQQQTGGYVAPITDDTHLNESNKPEAAPVTDTNAVEGAGDDIAQGVLMQGKLMMEDAAALQRDAEAKLEEAYKLDPSLRPVKRGRPKKSDTALKA